ncbi:hypothetical protein OKA04_08005 [Luteolibacter flavescens]|uniref:Uncharacterized protein n=1 Tax=Luteolibacter flavescens TaxID=1859460 RepID=A0ABT3FM74_9BACT|nr:hypothetical protein [Luteolibacter flavescens]MCW1884671.1 hypothetical protein [Luteolibacter flavescens]
MKLLLSVCLLAMLAGPVHAEPEAKPAAAPVEPEVALANAKTTILNLRQLHIGLIGFDSDYGAFPNSETAAEVKDATGSILDMEGDSSNTYFRQLIASTAKTETIFQIGGRMAPDNDFSDSTKALAAGECGISYIPGLSTSNNSATPVAMAPLVTGKMAFDPVPFGGKAVILRIDGSATIEPITAEGDVILGGKSIFDPAQPFWKGKKPKVAWPE